MLGSRVPRGAFERLEPLEGKLSRAVLRGGGDGNVTSLPDPWGSNPPGPPGRISGVTLLEQALNLRTPVIYDTVMNGDREERVVNQEETLAAREKQKRIKEAF